MLKTNKYYSPVASLIILMAVSIRFALSNTTEAKSKTLEEELDPEHPNFNFRGFLKKYSPSNVWEDIDKKRKYEGAKISDEEQLDIMFKSLDQTDDVFNLRIGADVPENDYLPDGRRYGWQPPKRLQSFRFDHHFNRPRIYELMRQAIYQARNRMIVMQINRERYRKSPIYKMGFLTNKADIAVKTFCKVSFSSLRTCVASRTATVMRSPVSELVEFNHKQLMLWLDVQILSQIIRKNYDMAVEILKDKNIDKKKLALNERIII